MNTNKKYRKIPLDVSIHLRYLYQDKKENLKDLMKRYPQYARTSIFRHSKVPIGDLKIDRRHQNKGRPPSLTNRASRLIVNTILKLRKEWGKFSIPDLKKPPV